MSPPLLPRALGSTELRGSREGDRQLLARLRLRRNNETLRWEGTRRKVQRVGKPPWVGDRAGAQLDQEASRVKDNPPAVDP